MELDAALCPQLAAMGLLKHQLSPVSAAGRQLASHYDVFLSFRGPDTRRGFMDCLYTRLVDAGLFVFRDLEELRVGEEIHPTLIEAINRAEISIPIISRDFASSRSCLLELAHILHRRRTDGHKVIPVFYDVNPSNLKEYAQSFEKSLELHMEKQDGHIIDDWRTALRDIGGLKLKGYYVPETHDGYQGNLIKTVVTHVLEQLRKHKLIVTDTLVGVDDNVVEIMRKLDIAYCDGQAVEIRDENVRVVGICGLPGVGKTTLAKCVFNKILHLFETCSFLPNIREKSTRADGLVLLQEKLVVDLQSRECAKIRCCDDGITILSSSFRKRRVLIFLDDTHDVEQIQALAANFNWFGPGSRIILTTRTREVLSGFEGGVVKTFMVRPLREDQALRLFRMYAFQSNPPDPDAGYDYDSLSIKISKETGGLPLANVVVGSYLNRHTSRMDIWKETQQLLSTRPDNKVETAFGVSYRFLDEEKKEMFLDVACFFSGMDKRITSYLWTECGYHPSIGIESLCDMSLVEIGEDNVLHMHDQLRKFGRELVAREDSEPCRRSRLWNHIDAISTLRGERGTDRICAIGLECGNRDDRLMDRHFRGLLKLKFLKLDRADIKGNFKDLLENLRWLDWQGCPTKTSKLRNLNLEKLVILDLSRSQVDHRWKGWKLLIKKAKVLKVLNLTGCEKLVKSPDFQATMILERLILQSCSQLSVILPSISNLAKLVSLDLRHCYLIGWLPELGTMESLEELLLDGTSIRQIPFQVGSMHKLKILSACKCRMLEELPDSIGYQLTSLTTLALDGAIEITRIPDSIILLKRLQFLSIRDCKKVTTLPHDIGNLNLLETLDLSCTSVKELPPSVSDLKNLKVLKMERTYLRIFPKSIGNLEKLEEIDFSGCRNMEGEIPPNVMGLSSLSILRLSFTKISKLPDNVCKLFNLQLIDIRGCDHLQTPIPAFPMGSNVFR